MTNRSDDLRRESVVVRGSRAGNPLSSVSRPMLMVRIHVPLSYLQREYSGIGNEPLSYHEFDQFGCACAAERLSAMAAAAMMTVGRWSSCRLPGVARYLVQVARKGRVQMHVDDR